MKLKVSNYYKPTPNKWRKVGDSLLATGVFITSGGLLAFDNLTAIFSSQELKAIIGFAFIMGVAGKFITNMVAPTGNVNIGQPNENNTPN